MHLAPSYREKKPPPPPTPFSNANCVPYTPTNPQISQRPRTPAHLLRGVGREVRQKLQAPLRSGSHAHHWGGNHHSIPLSLFELQIRCEISWRIKLLEENVRLDKPGCGTFFEKK